MFRRPARLSARHLWPLPVFLLLVLLIVLWDWNWFRPLLERQASKAVQRTVHIANLDVRVGWHPDVELRGIVVDNPADFPQDAPPLASLQRLALRFDVRALFDRQVRIATLDIDQPELRLQQSPQGARNWAFSPGESEPAATPWQVDIAALRIREGRYAVADDALRLNLQGTVQTLEATDGGEAKILAEAEGRYGGAPLTARFIGGSVLGLRTPENPYPVDFQAESQGSRIRLQGTLLNPLAFAGAKLQLALQGPNLSALADLTQLPLPNTPPYTLEGALDYAAPHIQFRKVRGVVGGSDLAGDISVRLRPPRPLLQAELHSRQLRLEDLSGLIGGDPNAPAATAPGGNGKLLPATPISVPRLQMADVQFRFTGDRIVGDKLPFDRLSFLLRIDDGVLRASPVDMGIGEGALRFYATLDPRGEQLGLEATAELRKVNIAQLLEKTGYKGSGRIGGSATLKGKGRSAAELLGHGDGTLKLAMAGGDFSALLLDLAGLDFGNATLSLLGVTPRTPVRCLVGDFAMQDGLLDTRSFVLDTGTTNLLLDGQANFQNEALNLRLRTQPKRANIARLKAPIHIRGSFAAPTVRPDVVDLSVRAGAAVALGVLVAPLAAILPTLQLGPGEDRDCQALLAEANAKPPPQPPR